MASVSGSTTPFWIKFFTDAGIPAGEAANYAVTFTDHRIQVDMLLDLNKEYLNDMGITMMGDIIAILRHAKLAHAQNAREKALKGAASVPPAAEASASSRRKTPASRMVDHHLNLSSDPDAGPMNSSRSPARPTLSEDMQLRLGTPAGGRQSPASNIVKLSSTRQKEEVPVPKFRRVLPEHEGRYKVIMPSGTTKKTRKILEKQGLAVPAKNVFARLGQSTGSAADSASTSSPKIRVTGLGKITLPNSSSSDEGSSVFSRLGGKTAVKRPATSTSNLGDAVDSDSSSEYGGGLEYAGVLKVSPAKRRALEAKKRALETQRKMAVKKKLATVSKAVCPAQPKTQGIFGHDGEDEKVPLKHRLGPKVSSTSASASARSSASTTRKPVATTSKKGVYSRLGPQLEVSSTADVPRTKLSKDQGVFSRLGKQL